MHQLEPLADVNQLAAQLSADPSDPELRRELVAASNRFRNEVRRTISRVTDDVATLDGGGQRTLRLPSAPVVKVTEAAIDGQPVEVRVSEHGLMRRADGQAWPDDLGNVTVVYTHGYERIPDEIQEVVLDAAADRLSVQRGLSTLQVGGITQTFSRAAQGGVTEAWAAAVERWAIRRGDRA